MGYWGVRLSWWAVWRIRLDKVVQKYSQKEKLSIFLYNSLLFSIIKRKNRCRRWRAGYISMRRTLYVFHLWVFFDYLREKEDGVQFRILQLHYHWLGIISSITWHKFVMDIICVLSICFEKHWDVLWQSFKNHMNKQLVQ